MTPRSNFRNLVRVPVASLLACMLVLAGCSDSGDRLTATVRSFADALSRGDVATAAALTTDEAAATETLGDLFASLGTDVHVDVGTVEEEDGAASFGLDTAWKFGPEKRNEWRYSTDGTAADDGDDWKIHWNPATVAPGLDEEPLSYSTLVPQPATRNPRPGYWTAPAPNCSPSTSSRWSRSHRVLT